MPPINDLDQEPTVDADSRPEAIASEQRHDPPDTAVGTADGEPSRREESTVAASRGVDAAEARQVAERAREQAWERPSFGRQLFLGDLDLDLIHPLPRPSAEDRAAGEEFLERFERYLTENVDPKAIERDAMIPVEAIDGLRELGALGMKIPTEYGGLGLSTTYYLRALALAGSWHASLSALLSAHQSIGVPQPVALAGTEEQKREWLPRCTREISAFLLTEPDVGSDPARLSASATPTEDGSGYVLNGVKLWTTNGVIADLAVVMARVPEHEHGPGGISAFIVECDAPGVVVEHRNEFMGLRGIENGVTRFTDVRVPRENRIGGEGEGLKIALQTLNTGRLSLPAICSAAGKWALKIAREWSAERVQWGSPIGQHEAVAEMISFIAGTAFGMDAVVEVSSALADEGGKDIRIEAAIAKLWASEMAWQVSDVLMQIRGGRGYETAASLERRGERPVPVEQVMRDLRINRIFEGSSEIMKLLIAREAVDQHLSVAGELIEPDATVGEKARTAAAAARFYAGWLPGLLVGRGTVPIGYSSEFGSLGEHLRYVERTARKLARHLFAAMSRWQAKLERKQSFLGRIVDIGAEMYAIAAACTYARALADEGMGDPAAVRDLADLFCRQSRRRIEQSFDALWDNDDDLGYDLAQRTLEGEMMWLEWGFLDPSGDGPLVGEPAPSPDVRHDHPAAPTPAGSAG
ncbi:MAG: acyl-CoA dehydrogenase family protein [Actinobacteria bacterium]|nr:acyl-CoA dehydrogenase family protein [Actinomycetota bacterium]